MPTDKRVLICDVQRFSVHDGPGIRTTIFFKGCPLACRWCQNPETIAFQNEPVYTASDCIGCGDCADACPNGAIEISNGSLHIDRSQCSACLKCTEVCPSGAMSPAARPYDAETLLGEACRDADYYGDTGGITLSGGEPLAHADFLAGFLPKAKRAGLHVTAETAGHVSSEKLRGLARFIDLFLYDLKAADDRRHRELTGRPNRLIIDNLKMLINEGRQVQVRMPLVPGHNDDERNLELTARLLKSLGVAVITLLPYHRLGQGKLLKVKPPYEPIESHPPSAAELDAVVDSFGLYGIEAKRS